MTTQDQQRTAALGRQVQKGQRGVKIHTWIVCKTKDDDAKKNEAGTYKRRRTVSVFHISQTERKS